MEEDEEARANHCREMISLVRSKQQSSVESRRLTHKGAGGRQRSERDRRERDQNSPGLKCQGPEVQPVPPQLISVLRLKTFKEEMRRVRTNKTIQNKTLFSESVPYTKS